MRNLLKSYDNLPPPRFYFTKNEQEQAKDFLLKRGVNSQTSLLFVFHVGAGSEQKRAPFEVFLSILNRFMRHFPIHLLLTNGPADEEIVFQFQKVIPKQINHTLLTCLPLRKLAAILSHCDITVGNDSGVTHIAAASGCPTLALFKNSNPILWRPIGEHTCYRVI